MLTETLYLAHYNSNLLITIYTDTSRKILGATISAEQHKIDLKQLALASRFEH